MSKRTMTWLVVALVALVFYWYFIKGGASGGKTIPAPGATAPTGTNT